MKFERGSKLWEFIEVFLSVSSKLNVAKKTEINFIRQVNLYPGPLLQEHLLSQPKVQCRFYCNVCIKLNVCFSNCHAFKIFATAMNEQ